VRERHRLAETARDGHGVGTGGGGALGGIARRMPDGRPRQQAHAQGAVGGRQEGEGFVAQRQHLGVGGAVRHAESAVR
jgi:hypothetical protein